ncbi:hypothetical protein [Methylocystis parvus]|uniref:Phosphoribosyltransferase n=1 Tax=Methylocystis parvus TaxID=134 RepID=A0A6B8MAM1_9HYPH|nr:hypothetical protein [Methylocystis parvus]QGM97700.1 hypothetical protein F7D14_09625 [Methylocystis parvus]WBJ98365.1 hypothetical protein MMG94_09965 [Methylocystis parvus OBBP]
MTTFDASWSGKLRLVGDLERPDHWHLAAQDQCYFFGDYTARAGYAHSATNGLISNLKKKPSTRNTPQWKYKSGAIRDVGQAIARNLTPEALSTVTFVPIPPSKPQTSPDYDDRMVQVAKAIGPNIDLREAIFTRAEREAMHVNDGRRDPHALRESLGLKSELTKSRPAQVILLDDVLTTGCSFTVCKSLLAEVWPGVDIFGVFVARRVIDRTIDFEDLSGIEI